jgi:hypothetical protein
LRGCYYIDEAALQSLVDTWKNAKQDDYPMKNSNAYLNIQGCSSTIPEVLLKKIIATMITISNKSAKKNSGESFTTLKFSNTDKLTDSCFKKLPTNLAKICVPSEYIYIYRSIENINFY